MEFICFWVSGNGFWNLEPPSSASLLVKCEGKIDIDNLQGIHWEDNYPSFEIEISTFYMAFAVSFCDAVFSKLKDFERKNWAEKAQRILKYSSLHPFSGAVRFDNIYFL